MAQSPPLPPCPPDGDRAIVPPLPVVPAVQRAEVAESHSVRELPAPPKIAAPPPPLPPENADKRASTYGPSWWSDDGAVRSSAWLVSFVVHAIALFLLGLVTLTVHSGGGGGLGLLASTDGAGSGDGDFGQGDIDQQATVVAPVAPGDNLAKDALADAKPVDLPAENTKIILPPDGLGKINVDKPVAGDDGGGDEGGGGAGGEGTGARGTGGRAVSGEGGRPTGRGKSSLAPSGGGWEGRNPAGRAKAAGGGGGSRQSEAAVERGLVWLVAHQREDGSWCFDLEKTSCKGMCRNSGSEPSTTAATGLALLPFLAPDTRTCRASIGRP